MYAFLIYEDGRGVTGESVSNKIDRRLTKQIFWYEITWVSTYIIHHSGHDHIHLIGRRQMYPNNLPEQ